MMVPYACAEISNMVMRGGFPPVYLAPVNFEVMYQQQLKEAAEKSMIEKTH